VDFPWRAALAALVLVFSAASAAAASLSAVADEESQAAFNFFWEQANSTRGSPGFGLIRDRWPGNPGVASIASVGFGLSAIAVGVERGWVTCADGEARAEGTLDTFLRLATEHGFFYDTLDMQSGARARDSEVSIIDTGLFLAGALTAGRYFGGEVQVKAYNLYEHVDWPWFVDAAKNQFWMAWRPGTGFEGHWDSYAGQLILYVLAAGSPLHPVDPHLYDGFTRNHASTGGRTAFISAPSGDPLSYQLSQAWVDFRGLRDKDGVSWFDNSVAAARAQDQAATDGAGESPGNQQQAAGSMVRPSAAIGSIIFTPAESLAAMDRYRVFPSLWGKYGFTDGYDPDVSPTRFDPDVSGTDAGISLLMIENARDGLVWEVFMGADPVQTGLSRLGVTG
jgi:hypothetical protein